MTLTTTIILLIASALLLVKSADVLVNNAEKLGLSLRVPPFLVGVIILSIGTSLPELAAGISATVKGHSELVTADIMGSNIANIFLGLGAVALITQKHIQFKQNVFEVHFPILAMAVFAFLISIWDQVITAGEGAIFFVIMLAYIWFLTAKHAQNSLPLGKGELSKTEGIESATEKIIPFVWRYPLWIFIGGVGIAGAAHILIESIIKASELMGLVESVLAASLVSVSTSLPEMVVGFKAAKSGQYDVLVGNILGSNIFNIVLILSVTSFIHPVAVSDQAIELLLPFFVGSIVVYWVCQKDRQITIQEGTAMTILYLMYLGKLYGVV
jgi:cation:H+ antiporter